LTIKFCPVCDNFLVPRNKKLYCKACEKEYDLDPKKDGYKIGKTIKHDEKESAPVVVKESLKGDRISAQDRKAYEEFFDLSEADY
jgi:DNA-directed RNA polymerase subunit M/transcription elongation factor TFIIS